MFGKLKRCKNMVKNTINKPKFGRLFAERFIVVLIGFSIVAAYALVLLYDSIYQDRTNSLNSIRDEIVARTMELCETVPDSEDYENKLNKLYLSLGMYQTYEHSYAEVRINDFKISLDNDFGFITIIEGTDVDLYILEDASYLEPVDSFQNGKFDGHNYLNRISKLHLDPVIKNVLYDNISRTYSLSSAYINRETHSFIPGVVKILENGKEYEVDCTPADIKGYEYLECDRRNILGFLLYRMTTDLSSEDIDFYYIPAKDGTPFRVQTGGELVKENETWCVGFTDMAKGSVFSLAPITSSIIILIDITLAALVALGIAYVKYQKEKTVWTIFEYRTKTMEAMAHDLKTPLAAIMAYAENMESHPDDPEKLCDYSQKITEKVKTMDHMIEDILMFSRSETGKIEIKTEEVSVKSLINECMLSFPYMNVIVSGNDIILTTDRKLFKQSIENLLSNCGRYGDNGSAVNIQIETDKVTITNKTTMTYKNVNSLKQPFVKGNDSRGNKGTGLGLSIAENNLDILGYKLVLSSEDGIFKVSVIFI